MNNSASAFLSFPEVPDVDDTLCTGCGDCALVCPTRCLAMAGRLPWLPRPLDCVSCSLCVLICPAEALSLRDPAADG